MALGKKSRKFLSHGNLDKDRIFHKKVKPVIHSMMDADKKRVEREQEEHAEDERKHMEDVKRLQELDPEFREYLSKEEPDFGDAIEDQLEDELSAGEEDAAEDAEDAEPVEEELTTEEVEAAFEQIEATRSVKSIRKVLTLFRSAAQQGYLGVGENSHETGLPNPIRTTELFALIVSEATSVIPAVLDAVLGHKRKEGGKLPHKHENWEKVRGIAKLYISALAELLGSPGLPEALAAHALQHTVGFVTYGYTHAGAMRFLLKSALHHVANTNEKVQLVAFLCVREMAKPGNLPPPFTDICMKGMYLTFVKNTRSFSLETHGTVSYVMNECVELFGVDLASAYQHIFVYTRQLAVYLRTALQSGAGEEAFRHVYNWQYVNSLRLWAMTVARYNDEKELFPLVYPIAQIACGVVELFPAPKTFPLHLCVIGIINHLARRANIYVPVSGYLLRILSSPEFQKNYRDSDRKPTDLMFTLRAKKADMASLAYQNAVFAEAVYLLSEHLGNLSHTIGFPELAFPILTRLRRLQKEIRNPKWRQQITTLTQKINTNSAHIVSKRKGVNFGPSEVEKVTSFEATLKEAGTPYMKSFKKEMERREETRRMRLESLKEERRKTVDEYADDVESDDEEGEEDLAALAAADEGDQESSDDDEMDLEENPESDDEPEEQSKPAAPAAKRRRRN